jgi:hypothetical protein
MYMVRNINICINQINRIKSVDFYKKIKDNSRISDFISILDTHF